MEIEEDI